MPYVCCRSNVVIKGKNSFWRHYMLKRLQKSFAVFSLFVLFSATPSVSTAAHDLSASGIKTQVTLTNDSLLLSFVFSSIQLDGGLRYNVPKYPNSYIEISPDLESNGTMMAVNLSLLDINNKGIYALNPQTLPGGRALPGIASGRLPSIAFTIEKFYGVTIYASSSVFGLFIPAKIGIKNSIITARFNYGKNKDRGGNISLVGTDVNGKNSGLLMLFDLKSINKAQ